MSTQLSSDTQATRLVPGGVRELLTIAFPMVVSQACETLMMFTDRLMLSRLGPEYMSAAMGGGLVAFLLMTFFIGLTGYSTALVAQYLGAGQEKRCATAAMQGVWVALAAWPVIIACIPLGLWMFSASGIAAEQLAPQRAYFTILAYGAGIGLLRNCLGSFFSGIGKTKIVMAAAGVSLLVNVFFNWLLIFGKLGFPALGIEGAAIGTILGGFAGLLVLVGRYFAPSIRERFGVMEGFRIDRPLMAKLFRFGSPSGAEFFLNLLAFNTLVMVFHSYGLVEATAMTITFNWDLVSFIPLIGVGVGVTSLVGRYMGAGDPDTAHRATMSGVKVASMYTCITFTTFCIFPTAMVNIFRPAEESAVFAQVAPLATFMVRVMVAYLFADAMAIVFSSALRGAGDTFWTMVLSVSGHWASALACIAAVRWLDVGPKTSWLMVVGMVFTLASSFYLRYRYGAWRKIRVVEERASVPNEGAMAAETEV